MMESEVILFHFMYMDTKYMMRWKSAPRISDFYKSIFEYFVYFK